jgi:nucleoside-diphosphate-sugar epimerase
MAPTTVVTGAAGRIGRGVGAALRKLGHRVVGLDVLPAPAGLIGDSCDHFVQCDLAAAGAGAGEAHGLLHKAMEGVSSVVHCAAWPGPSAVPPPAVVASGAATPPQITLETTPPTLLLRDNVAATAAVCDAAVAAGATRFVFSSSAFAMGYSHAASGPQAYAPRYLPVDEAHGAMPHESYGLSKLVGEEVLECAARTAVHASFVSLRFTNIVKREKFHELPWPAPTLDQPPTMVLWAYTHEDDVIDAHVAAVLRPSAAAPGTHEPYLICAADSRYAEPTLPLLASVLGIVETPLRHPMAGNASPLSAAKARARLGFTPRSWQDGKGTRNQPAAADTEVKGRDAELSGGGGVSPPRGILVRGSAAARRALRDAGLRRFPLDGFALESGARLPPGATLAYKVQRLSGTMHGGGGGGGGYNAAHWRDSRIQGVGCQAPPAAPPRPNWRASRLWPPPCEVFSCRQHPTPFPPRRADPTPLQVHGPPVGSSPGGIILHPTSFDAVHDELEYNIGSGRTLDTDRYTVCAELS